MAASKTPKADGKKPAHSRKDRAAEVANAFEWLITAFILAFVFRAFVMEAFRIPTGSMADTLMGAHFRLRCPQCGYRYEYGFVPQSYRMPQDTIPPGPVPLQSPTRCPSCGYFTSGSEITPVANGDRILVLKCVYQYLDPKRWDVVVFKNPTNPMENYIKRLIGLPGEQVEIIDGDIYINGLIARKPASVQRELWMPVYDDDYHPVNPDQRGAFNGDHWQLPFNFEGSAWRISPTNPTQLVLDSPPGTLSTLTYGAPSANDFSIAYAYNDVRTYLRTPQCSDLMVRFYVQTHDSAHWGRVGIALSKQGIEYRAWLDFSGEMVLAKVNGGQETILGRTDVIPPSPGTFARVKFANVDHQLLFEVNDRRLSLDLGSTPDVLEKGTEPSPRASIFGTGKLTLSHTAIFRDIYYTGDGQAGRGGRAVEGNPFQLEANEFFVLGDNSPNSEDGRWWDRPAVANRGWEPPRAGIVPRYYMVGKALFVYWPSGFEFPWPQSIKAAILQSNSRNAALRIARGLISLRWIPNVGRMRFIYGGTAQKTGSVPREPPQSDTKSL